MKYTVKTSGKTALPRSKRLREAGIGGDSGSGGSVVMSQGAGGGANCDGHSHANKGALDAISIDNSNYLWLKQKLEGEADSSLNKVKAGYADDAGHAAEADHAKDADTWAKEKFADWLDQAVRKTDSVTFAKVHTNDVVSDDYATGMLGAGYRLAIVNGKALLEIDQLTVRQTMKVFELIIQQLKYQGGMIIYSAADMECTAVEDLADGYKCYFDTKNGQVRNGFELNDQARCQRFEIANTTMKYYWRLVTEVGDDYIVLSKSDCDTGSDAPEAGDVIVQLGNRTNPLRQSAKVTTTIDENSPRDDYYQGINTYDLTGKLITVVGVRDGQVGVFTKNGEFTGKVNITGGSGLDTLAEWNDLSESVSSAWAKALEATNAAAAAQKAADAAQAAVGELGEELDEWASDGVISPVEKQNLSLRLEDIKKEYSEIIANAARFGIDYSAFAAAYALATSALIKYTSNITQTTVKESDYGDIAAYYASRANILTAIAAGEKDAIDGAQSSADKAQEDANKALKRAAELAAILDEVNDDTILDQREKRVIRTEWITINGIEDLGAAGIRGSYITTKNQFAQYSSLGSSVIYSYNGVIYTYAGSVYSYKNIGIAALDIAYIELREFLRGVGLNDRESNYHGFDRSRFAALLTAYYDAESLVNDNTRKAIQNQISTIRAEILAEISNYQAAIDESIAEMQNQVDNTIENYFLSGVPTLSNMPAVEWTTDAIKTTHLGDLYYDEDTGFSYRFQQNTSGGFYWKALDDSAIARALNAAAAAQDTADGKRRTFLAQPTAADTYDRGDLWLHATIGSWNDETLVCQTSKAAGAAFSEAHWTTATKYTDDTVANAAKAAAQAAQNTANAAAQVAAQADSKANSAQAAANEANAKLGSWASDNVISPVEKEALRQQRDSITAEYASVVAEAASYGLSTTSYTSAYSKAIAALDKYTSTSAETITIESDYDNIAAYYSAHSVIAQAIAAAAKSAADNAQTAADNAQTAAENAQEAAEKAQAAVQTVTEALEKINVDNILDAAEKNEIRNTWTSINGIVSTGSRGKSGTYYAAKTMLTDEARVGLPVIYTFNGVSYTFNGVVYTYNNLGEARLDAAYLALREYLNSVQLNSEELFIGFNRERYADLLRDYYVALNNVLQILSDVAKQKAEDAQEDADEALEGLAAIKEVLQRFASDGYISAQEKLTLKTALQDESTNYVSLIAQSARYNTTTVAAAKDAMVAAFTAYKRVVDYYCLASTWANDIAVSSNYPLSAISGYYQARENLIDAINAAEKALIDEKAKAADYEYLKSALPPDSSTEVYGGLLLGNIIGVKDENNKVVAALNGLSSISSFKHNTHGTLLIVAGISDMETAATTAKTRIFADGTIITSALKATDAEISGKITATSGQIGGFEIGNNYIGISTNVGASGGSTGFSLFTSFLRFYGTENYGSHYFFAGSNVWPSSGAGTNVLMRLESTGDSSASMWGYESVGARIDISGFSNNYAIYCIGGVYAGFRQQIILKNSSYTLSNMDNVLICDNTAEVIYTLPSAPKHGQCYTLIHPQKNKLTVKSTATHPIRRVSTSGSGWGTQWESTSQEVVLLWYNEKASVTYNSATRNGVWFLTYIKI